MLFKYYLAKWSIPFIVLSCTSAAFADSRYDYNGYYRSGYISRPGSHAGEMDTDGILSPGELRNPRINYSNVQRWAERRGDWRYDNPINDRAAADTRYYYSNNGSNWQNGKDRYDNRNYGYDNTRNSRQWQRGWGTW